MSQQQDNKFLQNKKYRTATRKIVRVFGQKVNDRAQILFQKLKVISIKKSPQFIALQCTQILKRLSKVFTLKLRQVFNTLLINSTVMELQKKQKAIESTKIKDRVYQAKVKSLRVLSRQWKQKKSQNQYINKFFTPKSEQTPKMVKQKVSQSIFIALRNLLRNKYLNAFNAIKSSQAIRARNSRGLFLANYLLHKRKYWFTYGFEKLKVNVLLNREEKNKDEISQLDTRLVPVQDAQIVNLKQKQQKLQAALATVQNEKQAIVVQVQTEVTQIQTTLQQKRTQIQQLNEKKQKLLSDIQQSRQTTAKFQFNRDEIFHLIYKNFLFNLKLWSQSQSMDGSVSFLNKSLVLQWLQCPVIDFDFDKVLCQQQKQIDQIVQSLESTIDQYQRLRANDFPIDLNQVCQGFFSNVSANQCSGNYEELLCKIKFTCKMLGEIVKQNSQVMVSMLQGIQKGYEKLKGQSIQILDD